MKTARQIWRLVLARALRAQMPPPRESKMRSRRDLAYLLSLGLLALVMGATYGCSNSSDGHSLFGIGSAAFPTTPKFLIAVDSSGAGANINVFPINATTGVLGAPVSGSPFDRGMVCAITVAVHPNGHFVYAADSNDGSIHMWDVNETTGVPTEIAPRVINESGNFFQPNSGACGGDDPTHVLTVTPNGRFLYATNNDAMVSAYSIGSNGALSHIGDLNVGASNTGAITANNSFAWVTDTNSTSCGTVWHVMTMRIGSNGALTNVSTATLTSVFCWLWSISVSPDGRFVQVGDEGGNAQVYSFTVGADGSLTQAGPQVVLTNSSDARDIAFSPDSLFFYITDDDAEIHALQQNANGTFTELGASPYTGDDGQVVVDLTGRFVYSGGCTDCLGVYGYTRDATTGALTPIAGSPVATANNDVMAVGIIR